MSVDKIGGTHASTAHAVEHSAGERSIPGGRNEDAFAGAVSRVRRTSDEAGLDEGSGAAKKPRHAPSKSQALKNIVAATPDASPLSRLTDAPLIQKVDAPSAGDHSPSLSSVNRVEDQAMLMTGRRGTKADPSKLSLDQRDIPTLQMHGPDFTRADGSRDPVKGAQAHSQLTSLREMHGAGERDVHESQADLREAVAHSYSRIDGHGEIDWTAPPLPRVQVASERDPRNLLNTGQNASPRIAQGIVNLSYAVTEAQHARPDGRLAPELNGLAIRKK